MKKINWHKQVSLPLSLAILALLALIALSGLTVYTYFLNNKKIDQEKKEIHQSGYKYISPLLECADFEYKNREDLEENISELIDEEIKKGDVNFISLYFRDLNNGPWIGINEKETFTPASLLKVPLMIAYLKIAEKDPSILEKKILTENNQNLLSQNIIPLRTVEAGKEYKVEELIEYMIIYSDNLAADALLRHIDLESLNNTYRDLGIPVPDGKKVDDFMSVRDYSSFFRILYNASYLNHEMSEKALKILTKSQFVQGLTAGVPAQVEIAHKFGERISGNKKQLHDCGIIYKENSPYLLCIMTRGQDFSKMGEVISEISALVYREFK